MLRVYEFELRDIVDEAKGYGADTWICIRQVHQDGAATEKLVVAVERYDERGRKDRLRWSQGCDYCVIDVKEEAQLRELASREGVSVVAGDVLDLDELEILSCDV